LKNTRGKNGPVFSNMNHSILSIIPCVLGALRWAFGKYSFVSMHGMRASEWACMEMLFGWIENSLNNSTLFFPLCGTDLPTAHVHNGADSLNGKTVLPVYP